MGKNEVTAGLHIIATPIGNLADISFRAVETMRSVDVLYCEDTRVTRKLLHAYQIKTPLRRYDDHTGESTRIKIAEHIIAGQAVGLCSDAGTPIIADPGFKLVRYLVDQGLPVMGVPGATASIHALVLSGLPSDKFAFLGFPPPKKMAREQFLRSTKDIPFTLIFYEAPHRLVEFLLSVGEIMPGRTIVVARELTKTFEQVRRGTAQELIDFYQLYPAKGECVVLVGPLDQNNDRWDEDRLKEAIVNNLSAHKPRQLAHHLSEPSRWSSSEIYALITDIKKK